MLDEYQTRLPVNAITEQMNSARDSVRVINSTSSAVQVTRALSGVVQSQHLLSTLQCAQTVPIDGGFCHVFQRVRSALT